MSSTSDSQPAAPKFNPAPAFRNTQSPDPSWSLGEGLKTSATQLAREWKEDEKQGWTTLDLGELSKPETYMFLTSAVTPRPVAFVSSLSETGERNLAPFSYFSLVSHDPPLVSVSFTLSPRRPKDTRENIKATKEFVVNIISEPFIEAANACSVEAPADIDEWIVSGLTPEPSTVVKPPRVRESALSFECELYHLLDIPSTTSAESLGSTLVLGLIRTVHVRNAVLAPPPPAGAHPISSRPGGPVTVDSAKLRAVSRLGGITFARVGEGFDIARPSWREVEGEVREMMKKAKEKESKGSE